MERLRFTRFHPLVSFLFYVGAVMLAILLQHPVFLLSSLLIVFLINIIHDRLAGLMRWKYFLIITFLLMTILNPLFNQRGRHLLFEMGGHRVTLEAVLYGSMNALSIITIIAIFISYNVMMTPNKLLYLFSKFLPQFAILLMLTLRFIPLMRRRLEEISIIQKSKGISVRNGNWKTRVKTGMQFVQALLTFSLEEAIQTADSMKARGYGEGQRSSYEYFRFRVPDLLAMLFLAVLFLLIIYGRILGYGFLTVYPLLETWKFSGMDLAVFCCCMMFLCFPILVEAGGRFRWHISN